MAGPLILDHVRFAETATFTYGLLRVDGVTYAIGEDGHNVPKIPGKTRISAGRYPVTLRTASPMAERYRERFGPDHLGMIWIRHVPDFQWVYCHVGNDEDDTDGCPLIGTAADFRADSVRNSVTAYRHFYPVVMRALTDGRDVFWQIRERFV